MEVSYFIDRELGVGWDWDLDGGKSPQGHTGP